MPGCLSSRPNWVPSPPHPQGSVAPTHLGLRGETHTIAGEGVGAPNADEGTNTLVLYVYYNPSMVASMTVLAGGGGGSGANFL